MAARALVLCYHNLVTDAMSAPQLEAHLALPVQRFAAHLAYLAKHYRAVTFDHLDRATPQTPALVLTFDDGYRAVLEHALPLLARHQIPAYVFINPAFVGGWNPRDQLMGLALYGSPRARRAVTDVLEAPVVSGGRQQVFALFRAALWQACRRHAIATFEALQRVFAEHADDEVRMRLAPSRLLTWDELAVLRAAGVRIGNHTYRHFELDSLPNDLLREEIRLGQQAIVERLGREEPVISYPRNKTSHAVMAEAAAAGYRWGLTTVPGWLQGSEPMLAAPRVAPGSTDGVLVLRWNSSRLRAWAFRQGGRRILSEQWRRWRQRTWQAEIGCRY